MLVRMTNLSLKGFKTIRELVDFKPRPLNILIGANGAGKTNFISFFRLMSRMMSERLQEYVAEVGGARSLLHEGPDRTREIEAEISLETENGMNEYVFRLFYAAGDILVFADEKYRFSRQGYPAVAPWSTLGVGHKETKLVSAAATNDTARVLLALLRKCIGHQFHNTSATSRIRGKWSVADNKRLKEDAANLAPYLMRLHDQKPECYRRIVEVLRTVVPFFSEFEFQPEYHKVLLKWREKGSDMVFDVSQASDGMLRTMALVALLSQPEPDLPAVLVLDEPELGLHPYAIEIVAGMLRSASEHSQIVVATQSAPLVDAFEPEDVIVVDREGRESRFRRLNGDDLRGWLTEYTLGELWQKNVLGGRPTR